MVSPCRLYPHSPPAVYCQLRAWARQADQRSGAMPTDIFPGQGHLPSAEDEIRCLKRELEVSEIF